MQQPTFSHEHMRTHTFEFRTEKNNNNNGFIQQPNSSDGFAEMKHSPKNSHWLISNIMSEISWWKKEAFVHMPAPSTILKVWKIKL